MEVHKLDERVRQRRDKAQRRGGDGKQAHRTRRTHPRSTRTALQFLTQNLQGFAMTGTKVTDWFDVFGALNSGVPVDAVFVQETRAHGHWPSTLAARYENAWGFATGALTTSLSYWSSSETAAAGVAILINPKTEIQSLQPVWRDVWSPHFLAVQGRHDGQRITLVCVYGPTASSAREQLFNRLAALPIPSGVIVIGGDFNCTLDPELDRSRTTRKNYSSVALARWIKNWDLVDGTIADALDASDREEIEEYRARHHTFHYGYHNGQHASCRLDRWYMDRESVSRVIHVETTVPAVRADHQAVYLQVSHATPRRITKTRRQVLRYPLPRCAGLSITSLSTSWLETHGSRLSAMDPEASAAEWDTLKTELRRECLIERRRRLRLATAAYRRQVFRLRLVLKNATKAHVRGPATVQTVTANMELLALDEHARVQSIRRSLIAVRQKLLARRQRAKFSQYAGAGPTSTRAFYKRISVKFGARRTPITQHAPQDPAVQDSFFAKFPAPRGAVDTSGIDAAITEAEVRTAIRTCRRGKACESDGLPNDWYRDQIDVLPAVLAPLFTSWHQGNYLPLSFRQATVYCIPKGSAPQSGLDFRPIALLNTDYKIYARVLLNRIRPYLSGLVSATQYGFVPGRQVHDAIDVWTAARRLVVEDQVDSTALVLLLDFAKAYDTLDRRFLLLALRRHGFTETFVSTVSAMHLATTATYLADGSESSAHSVTTGIRQGCPLAPVLFVLALDTLYETIEGDEGLQGIALAGSTRLKVASFADDTSLFLHSVKEEQICVEHLNAFGDASGLRVSIRKSHALFLHPHGRDEAECVHVIKVVAHAQLLRHLGAQIASDPNRAMIWEMTLQQLRARSALAQVKTVNLLQLVQICKAVILPKLLFVGRHAWPSRATIDKLQRLISNYAWHGALTMEATPGRASLNRDTAELPAKAGGLGLPNVLHEFELLGAKAAARWALPATQVAASVGAIMLWKPHKGRHPKNVLAVSRAPAPPIRCSDTMATTGASVLRHVLTQPRDDTELDLIDKAWTADASTSASGVWAGDWLYISMEQCRETLNLFGKYQSAAHGVFQIQALLNAHVGEDEVLIGPLGRAINRKDLGSFAYEAHTIGDTVDIESYGEWVLRFRPRTGKKKTIGCKAARFEMFCRALVINYPALILPQNPGEYLHPQPPTLDRWALIPTLLGNALEWEPVTGKMGLLEYVHSIAEAVTLARAVNPAVGTFHDHPWLAATTAIWANSSRRVGARTFKRAVDATTVARGLQVVAAKATQSTREDPALVDSLGSLSWVDIANLNHGTSAQRLLLFRLKHMRLGGWDRVHSRRGCPHCPSARSEAGTSFHTVWTCPQAQLLWDHVRDTWTQWGAWSNAEEDGQYHQACIRLWLTRVPPAAWELPVLRQIDLDDAQKVVPVFKHFNELW